MFALSKEQSILSRRQFGFFFRIMPLSRLRFFLSPVKHPKAERWHLHAVLLLTISDHESAESRKTSSATRKMWSKEEEEELLVLFAKNFEIKKNPEMKECLAAVAKSRENKGGIIHERRWETIKKKVIRMLKKFPP